jgi:hypothetical protein
MSTTSLTAPAGWTGVEGSGHDKAAVLESEPSRG